MTLFEAVAKAAAEIDGQIERNRQRFEQSLIDHHAPAEDLDFLREWEHDHAQAWRAERLAQISAALLAEYAPSSVTVH